LIRRLVGIVRGTVQAQATTVGVGVTVDALTAMPLCAATLDLNAAVIGSLIVMPAAVASAAVKLANGAGLGLQLDNTPFAAICTTSGVLTVTYGAASTGVIDWYMEWSPLTNGFGIPTVT
jgi:hypothetical protein